MSKELGMIHTVNSNFVVDTNSATTVVGNIDLARQLTKQLERMCRQGNYYKVVGVDMVLDTVGTVGGGQISGHLRYYAPTRGRCAAYRQAFRQMAELMKTQGISMGKNSQYDFRVALSNDSGAFTNQASLDGTNGLIFKHNTTPNPDIEILANYNKSVQPSNDKAAGDLFPAGLATVLSGSGRPDFVLNDEAMYNGTVDFASDDYEKIPFTVSYTPDTTDITTAFQWRPDPALFLAVLTGQFDIYIEEVELDGGASGLNLRVATYVAGWKSIMGSPDRKRKSGAAKSATGGGRKK